MILNLNCLSLYCRDHDVPDKINCYAENYSPRDQYSCSQSIKYDMNQSTYSEFIKLDADAETVSLDFIESTSCTPKPNDENTKDNRDTLLLNNENFKIITDAHTYEWRNSEYDNTVILQCNKSGDQTGKLYCI